MDALLAANNDRDAPPTLPSGSRRLAEDVLILAAHDDIADPAGLWREAGADRVDMILPFGVSEQELRTAVLAAAPASAASAPTPP